MRAGGLAGFALGAALLAGAEAPSQDNEPTPAVVNERLDAMNGMAAAMKAMSQRIESGRDLAGIRELALQVRSVAVAIPALFPPGSRKGLTNATEAV